MQLLWLLFGVLCLVAHGTSARRRRSDSSSTVTVVDTREDNSYVQLAKKLVAGEGFAEKLSNKKYLGQGFVGQVYQLDDEWVLKLPVQKTTVELLKQEASHYTCGHRVLEQARAVLSTTDGKVPAALANAEVLPAVLAEYDGTVAILKPLVRGLAYDNPKFKKPGHAEFLQPPLAGCGHASDLFCKAAVYLNSEKPYIDALRGAQEFYRGMARATNLLVDNETPVDFFLADLKTPNLMWGSTAFSPSPDSDHLILADIQCYKKHLPAARLRGVYEPLDSAAFFTAFEPSWSFLLGHLWADLTFMDARIESVNRKTCENAAQTVFGDEIRVPVYARNSLSGPVLRKAYSDYELEKMICTSVGCRFDRHECVA